MKEFDTICGIATPIGEGGISIIRVSGDRSKEIVNKIFCAKNGKSMDDMKSYTMRYGYIKDINNKDTIDEVIISFMKGPRSFTAEDVIEINCHGGVISTNKVLEEVIKAGARLSEPGEFTKRAFGPRSFTAEDVIEINCHGGVISTNKVLEEVIKAGARLSEPGEFTKRAFLNGRIDLSQAEAVMDIIRAKTDLSMKSAMLQHEGALSKEINKLREYMLNTLALIEYAVDFTEDEEEIDPDIPIKVESEIKKAIDRMHYLLKNADEGRIIRDGLSLAIVGKPNVGKSSLLNALLKEKRAIVTDIPGTTRDIIEEFISLDGIPIRITDTAGIRETDDIVEKIGVEKSREKINEADLVILMLDTSRELEEEDRKIISSIIDKNYIALLNKVDLENKISEKEIVCYNMKVLYLRK